MDAAKRAKNKVLREALCTELRNKGNFMHSVGSVSEKPIVARRTGRNDVADDVTACVNCLGIYKKASLYRHRCKIVTQTSEGLVSKPGSVKAGKALFLQKKAKKLSDVGAKIMAGIRDDDMGQAIKTDHLGVELLEYMLGRGEGENPLWIQHFRYKLRLLGRFKIKTTELIPGAETLTDVLKSEHFLTMAAVAKEMAKEDKAGSRRRGGDSVPVKMGFMLQNCVKVLKGQTLREGNEERRKDTKRLLELYKMEWGNRYTTYHKPVPVSEDLKGVNEVMIPVVNFFSGLDLD